MLQLENIHKLDGKLIGEWMCYYVGEEGEYYRILFNPMTTTDIRAEFRLYKEDQIKGLWTLSGKLDNKANVVSALQTNPIRDVQALSIDELRTPDMFCAALGRSLFQFNEMLRVGIPTQWIPKTYNTSSLARRINGGGHSFGGHQIPKPPPISAPQWYVKEEEVKLPTMWETFKEMVKWDKWINIVFPMKQAIEEIIPKKKKITAKKAAY